MYNDFHKTSCHDLAADTCPFFDRAQGSCSASFFAQAPNNRKQDRLCRTEDHDRCPLFLSKVLRQAQTLRARQLAANTAVL